MQKGFFALFFVLAYWLGMQTLSPRGWHTWAQAADPDIAAQVRSAWERRSECVKSFECDCALETSRFDGPHATGTDAFGGGGTPTKDRQVVPIASKFSFCRAGDRLAYREQGNTWDEATGTLRTSKISAVYDGTRSKELFETDSLRHGTVLAGVQPSDILTVHANLTPLWLASSPIVQLERLSGVKVEKITTTQNDVKYDGISCVEVQTPTRNPKWRYLILVDPARDDVPLKFTQEFEGKPRRVLTMEYAAEEKLGWRPAKWYDKWFDSNGHMTQSTNGTVKRCSINTAPGEGVFQLEFPEGTEISN
jgi:hypothetical protein